MCAHQHSAERRAVVAGLQLLAVMAVLFILSAGSFAYWAGWAYLASFGACTFALTADLARRDPALLARRLQAGPTAEREPAQQRIQAVNGAACMLLVIVPGLDHRFAWSHVPLLLIAAGHLIVVACFILWFLVFRSNSYASSIVEVDADQRLVDTGPYAIVRHPMYAAALLLFIGTPLALASFWGLLPAAILTVGLVARLRHEEQYLLSHLPGYPAYRSRVRRRLVPGLW